MTAPSAQLGVTDRYTLEKSNALPAGRVMWCRDRKILGYGDVDNLHKIFGIPKGANRLVLSAADYDDVKGWIG